MMTKKISYESIPEFEKDFKRLGKKFKTLKDDFETMKRFTLETHYLQGVPTTALFPIEGFCSEDYKSVKVKKFACMSLSGRGGNSGIRVIFVVELEALKITFIEIYFKGDKKLEDRTRLSTFLKKLEDGKQYPGFYLC